MEKTISLSDRVAQAAGLAEAIKSIALCVGSTGVPCDGVKTAYAVFRGIERLSDVLCDELMVIADDVYETEMVSERQAEV